MLASAARSEEPADAFAQAAETLEGGPRIVAGLAAATALAESDSPQDALPFYESVEATPGVEPLYGHLAALRSVMARVGTAPAEELLAALAPLTAQDAPFAPLALEVDAGLKLELGRVDDARASLTAALADPRTSPGQKRRIQDLIDSLPPVAGAAEAAEPRRGQRSGRRRGQRGRRRELTRGAGAPAVTPGFRPIAAACRGE